MHQILNNASSHDIAFNIKYSYSFSDSVLQSFAVIGTEKYGIQAFAIKETFQRNIAHLRAILGHGHPHDVINITRPVVVPGGACGSYGDVLATVDIIVVIIVQVPRKERVLPVLQHLLDRFEAFRRVLPAWLVHEKKAHYLISRYIKEQDLVEQVLIGLRKAGLNIPKAPAN